MGDTVQSQEGVRICHLLASISFNKFIGVEAETNMKSGISVRKEKI